MLKEVICDKLGGREVQRQDGFLAGGVGSIPGDIPDLLQDGVALPEQLCLVPGSPK